MMTPANRTHYIGRRTFVAVAGLAAASVMLCDVTPAALAGEAPKSAPCTFEPGTYSAAWQGRKAPVEVTVTFSEDRIESVEIGENYETGPIAKTPFERIPAQVVEYQSLGIDTITGATLSSMAVLNGIEDCVGQAGGDVEALRAVPGPQKVERTVELETEVCIVGSGSSGTAAACEASLQGVPAVVIEQCANLGGNGLVSGGDLTWPVAPEEMRVDMNDTYRTYFAETLQKLLDMGTPAELVELVQKQYDDYYAAGGTKLFDSPEWQALYNIICAGSPVYDETLYQIMLAYVHGNIELHEWFGNFDFHWRTPLVAVAGYPWPCNAYTDEGQAGEGYFAPLDRYLQKHGEEVEYLFSTHADELIVEDGRVVGVKATCDDGTTYVVRASRGVIIATGGFSGNQDLVRKYDDEWGFADVDYIPTSNNYGHNGDGILMAESIGAALAEAHPNYMVVPFSNRVDYSIESIVGDHGNCLLVNQEGQRFVNESLSRNEIAHAQMAQTDQVMYLISDKVSSNVDEQGMTATGLNVDMLLQTNRAYKADTLEELAELIGVPAEALAQTCETYNAYAADGADPDFGRSYFTEKSRVKEPPFYACPMTWAVLITHVGVNVNRETFAALDGTGTEIPGLFAIGEAATAGGGLIVMYNGIKVIDGMLA